MAYYLALRHFGLLASQWDALSWWEQKMYLDGLEEEGLIETRQGGAPDATVVSEKVHQSGGTTIVDRKHEAHFSLVPGEMRAFGLPERSL